MLSLLALKVFFALWFFQSWWRCEILEWSFFYVANFVHLFHFSSLCSLWAAFTHPYHVIHNFSLPSCADGSVVFYLSLNFLQAVNRSFSEYLCLINNTLFPVILPKYSTFPLYFKALNFCIALRTVRYNLAKFMIYIHQLQLNFRILFV